MDRTQKAPIRSRIPSRDGTSLAEVMKARDDAGGGALLD